MCDHFAMVIRIPCVVALLWRLEDAHGVLIDELTEANEFFVGGDDLLERVEQSLLDQEAGFATQLHLEPVEAFGEYDAGIVCFEERSLFPGGIEAGMQLDGLPDGATTEGMPPDAVYTVTEVYGTHVVLDGNHPLAGMALRLSVSVAGVREASASEIESRSAGRPVVSLLHRDTAPTHFH